MTKQDKVKELVNMLEHIQDAATVLARECVCYKLSIPQAAGNPAFFDGWANKYAELKELRKEFEVIKGLLDIFQELAWQESE